jgi:hypothetical protein
MANRQNRNYGEGNPEAARRFNSAEKDFVKSGRGRRIIRSGAPASTTLDAGSDEDDLADDGTGTVEASMTRDRPGAKR